MVQTQDDLQQAYDEIPYPGVADPEGHVRCLEAMATLHGMRPADVGACRVLELGCASGRNLLAQAADHTGSRFVGIDFSADQIANGRAVVEALGQQNIELRQARIEEVDTSWGTFDYIICPGVFSWVRPETQEQILAICRQNLAPTGVAMISYNVYPGWHYRETVRDLLRYHAAAFPERKRQIAEARAVLEFVAENCPKETVQRRVFRGERDYLRTVRDDYLYHEYLVEVNLPLYFHEFVQRAESHGLQFVTDAEFFKMSGTFMLPAVRKVLATTPLVQRCQLLDYLRNESFHRTILCHRDVPLRRSWDGEAFRAFYVAVAKEPKRAEINVASREPDGFEFPQGRLTTSDPLGKAAMKHLVEVYPAAVSLTDLHAAALAMLPAEVQTKQNTGAEGLSVLANAMAGAFGAGLLRVYLHPPMFCRQVSERPCVSPLNRVEAARKSVLTSRVHENVLLDDFQSFLLTRLDGSRDRAMLYEAVSRAVAAGEIALPAEQQSPMQAVDTALSVFCARALLVS
jgi:SAM-dependent methyltransferase/methyltransferase-like protein